MAAVVPVRLTIEGQADDTAQIVREKERALEGSKMLPGVVRWKCRVRRVVRSVVPGRGGCSRAVSRTPRSRFG